MTGGKPLPACDDFPADRDLESLAGCRSDGRGAVPFDRLHGISQRCLAGETLTPDDMDWLGRKLAAFLEHRYATLEDAMGLRAGRGGVPWWRERAIRRRNVALRELAGRFYAGQCVSAQARAIFSLAIRYGATRWRHDRRLMAPPLPYSRAPHALLWQAFASGAPMPIGERRLRSILLRPVRKAESRRREATARVGCYEGTRDAGPLPCPPGDPSGQPAGSNRMPRRNGSISGFSDSANEGP
jgi:hypothetical protein